MIYDTKSKLYDILDFDSVTRLVDEHTSGKENRRLFIWGLLNVGEWLTKNIKDSTTVEAKIK